MPVISYHSLNGRIRSQVHSDGRKVPLLPDALGTVVATQSGTSAGRTYRSTPYGSTLQETGVNVRPRNEWVGSLGYRRTDMKHAEQHVRARHYSSTDGRWSTVDQLWPFCQAFVYAVGSPTKYVDPQGLQVQAPPGGPPITFPAQPPTIVPNPSAPVPIIPPVAPGQGCILICGAIALIELCTYTPGHPTGPFTCMVNASEMPFSQILKGADPLKIHQRKSAGVV